MMEVLGKTKGLAAEEHLLPLALGEAPLFGDLLLKWRIWLFSGTLLANDLLIIQRMELRYFSDS